MEIEMAQCGSTASTYPGKYSELMEKSEFVAQAMTESPGITVESVAAAGGETSVQALIDVILDSGNRMVLVNALNSPAISGWVREKIEEVLWGRDRQSPVLFRPYLH